MYNTHCFCFIIPCKSIASIIIHVAISTGFVVYYGSLIIYVAHSDALTLTIRPWKDKTLDKSKRVCSYIDHMTCCRPRANNVAMEREK